MPRYEWQQINHEEGTGHPFEVDGEIVPGSLQHADPQSTTLVALVRLPERDSGEVEALSEGVAEDSESAPSSPTCGVNDCSRSVDSPEDTCWQHDED